MKVEEFKVKRINIIDALKFMGIFAIFMGHYGDSAGRIYTFVFMYHVPLFFFISGCTASISRDRDIKEYLFDKAEKLFIPWLVFALTSGIFYILETDAGVTESMKILKLIVTGCVRNSFVAGSLWYLTCLFMMEIFFVLLKKLKLSAAGVIVIALVLNYCYECYSTGPAWWYNIDSALRYLIYFCIGYYSWKSIYKILQRIDIRKTVLFYIGSAVLILGTAFCFFGGEQYLHLESGGGGAYVGLCNLYNF